MERFLRPIRLIVKWFMSKQNRTFLARLILFFLFMFMLYWIIQLKLENDILTIKYQMAYEFGICS